MSHAKGILEAEEVEFLLESGNTNGKQHSATGGTQQVVTMRGDLEQIQLADIFQTLATAKMEGVLAYTTRSSSAKSTSMMATHESSFHNAPPTAASASD